MPAQKRSGVRDDVGAMVGGESHLNTGVDIDQERRERMARNAAALAAMGVLSAAKDLKKAVAEEKIKMHTIVAPAQRPATKKPRAPVPVGPIRRSNRLAGMTIPSMVELDDDGNPMVTHGAAEDGGVASSGGDGSGGGLLDLMANGSVRVRADVKVEELDEEQRANLEARRCSSKGRGGEYNSVLGLSCHFCRQKKLCGEDDCPRCSRRDASANCVGKSQCSRCRSSRGMFCRACLDVRYGQTLEEVADDPKWLCPHCYEEEHGSWREHGWFCNSSFCMRKNGRMPTGIAIHAARDLGYKSVAHMLQAKVLVMAKDAIPAVGQDTRPANSGQHAGPTVTAGVEAE